MVRLALELPMALVERLVVRPVLRRLREQEPSERQAAWEERASPV